MPKYLNQFRSAQFLEQVILDGQNAVVGTIRVKPSSVMWKPKGSHSFFSVNLDEFAAWITHPQSSAKKRKS